MNAKTNSSVSQQPPVPMSARTVEFSASAFESRRRRSTARVAFHLAYAIAQAVLSVWNALATQSFSAAQEQDSFWWSDRSVFAISAILEAVGLTFGLCMALLQYSVARERGLWSDMMSEPYMIAIEGMFDEGETGEFFFRVGLMGIYILFLCFLLANTVLSMLSGQNAIGVAFLGVSVLAGRKTLVSLVRCVRYRGWAAAELPAPNMVYILCVAPLLWIEAMEASILIRSDVSISNVFLVALDVVVVLPLAILTVGLVSAGSIAWVHCIFRSTIFMCFGYVLPETCVDRFRRSRMVQALDRFVPDFAAERSWWSKSKHPVGREILTRHRRLGPVERRFSYP